MSLLTRRAFLAGSGAAMGTLGLPRSNGLALAAEPGPVASLPKVPLSFAVALVEGHPAGDAAWIAERVAQMEALFGPLGVHPETVGVRAIGSGFAHLESRADRDALRAETRPHVVNVFVVGTLRDVDDPTLLRRGVHWRNRQVPSARYVILAAEAGPFVLAHEMGHYFGNGHSQTPSNLMSYTRGEAPVFLDAAQKRIIQASARQAFASGELVAPTTAIPEAGVAR